MHVLTSALIRHGPLFDSLFDQLFDQPVHCFRCIGIGIMSGAFDPSDRDAGFLMPGFVVAYAGSCMILLPTYEKRRTL